MGQFQTITKGRISGEAAPGSLGLDLVAPSLYVAGNNNSYVPVTDQIQNLAANGAIVIERGTVFITDTSAAALTLALPPATVNGLKLTIVALTAHAHVVTTPADGINGADDTATFAAAIGNFITLVSYNGVWYTCGLSGVTLTEV